MMATLNSRANPARGKRVAIACATSVGLLTMFGAGAATAESKITQASLKDSKFTTKVYKDCKELRSAGIGIVEQGTNLYEVNKARLDANHDGEICEREPAPKYYITVAPLALSQETDTIPVSIRADNGELKVKPKGSTKPAPKKSAKTSNSKVIKYTDCKQAEELHSGPIPKADPRYQAKFDKDNDGVACEANTPVHKANKAKVNKIKSGPKVVTDHY